MSWIQSQSTEIWGSCACAHHFVAISTIEIRNIIMNIFIPLYNTGCVAISKYNHKSLIFRLSLYSLNIILFMHSIVLAFDHAGFIFRWPITHFLESAWCTVLDVWPKKIDEQDDFPDYAERACQKILDWEAERWVLICGTGIGMSIAANRHLWIRAVLAYNPAVAKIARTHNDANVICFWARTMDLITVLASLEIFLKTDFLWGKYQRRNEKLDS